jgi:hypothetical protein
VLGALTVTYQWLLVASLCCAFAALLLMIRIRMLTRGERPRRLEAPQDNVDSMRDALERRLKRTSDPWV